jgi:protein phosphatase 1 regulatory subunit 7
MLNLFGNNINIIEGFEKFNNLNFLELSFNNIEKIENLSNLIKLEGLSLGNNKIR